MKSFKYNGKDVIGIKDMTTKQYWFSYGFILAWSLATLYVIIRSMFVEVYLIKSELLPVIMVTVFAFTWTYFIRRQVNRKNYIYKEK